MSLNRKGNSLPNFRFFPGPKTFCNPLKKMLIYYRVLAIRTFQILPCCYYSFDHTLLSLPTEFNSVIL